MEPIVENQDRITLTFIGKLDNGAVFMRVPADKPMSLRIGDAELPPSVEQTLTGMKIGETRTVRVDPDEGYGPRMKNLLHEVPRNTIGHRFEPKAGMLISQKVERDGKQHSVPATIIEVHDETVVLDYNHPLAGHHLTYELTVVAIEKFSQP
ncbi:FKBP-type peptidyl-prolyl cis-trans isomerase [Desulfofustis glycolicus]|uniref:Peptidyl-prolyl cis-trans isomerase n=1 Tax=Desulfofustis glycolicus DSM 9705 TaxID=1121409 RepID=A0A1M5U3I1_9BACT|nr:FKBP-type peptidyl-prolyl cis-trans isomerase [Desulfofustis glycolicus]MCB2214681.1 FKBP-type peptidyl-prolyl cis-trans isomerase [Desulfobulbaceae bacterium]SHH57421.1 FKBP-type peptidyl-prolyl cis-trans isomerase SlpA [Desulfofustis glycolicus DSM 9705]